VSTAPAPDEPEPEAEQSGHPPWPAMQYVGAGTALYGASVQSMAINNYYPGLPPFWQPGAAPPVPAAGFPRALRRLHELSRQLGLLTKAVQSAAEALTALYPSAGAQRPPSCSGGTPGPD
jgi:hypothetical protein